MSKLYVCEEYENPHEEGCRRICSIEEYDKKIRTKIIEELVDKLKDRMCYPECGNYYTVELDIYDIMEIEKQLKEEI